MRVTGIPSEEVDGYRRGEPDANGQAPLIERASGGRNPCRHCLGLIVEGEPMLILNYRPFAGAPQPYAESGPIFLHQAECQRYDSDVLPAWFAALDPAAIRGYGLNDWIRYETGQIVRGPELTQAAQSILAEDNVAYVHIRSKFGCFQARVDRT